MGKKTSTANKYKRIIFLIITVTILLLVWYSPLIPSSHANTAASSKEEKITITIWLSITYPYTMENVEILVNQFEKYNPNIHIKIVPIGEYDFTYVKTLNLDKIDKRDWPDIVLIYDVGLGSMMFNPNIIPVSHLMDINPQIFVHPVISYYTVNNTIYGLPINYSIPVLYINKTLAEKYNIDSAPDSLKDIYQICQSQANEDISLLSFPLHAWTIEELLAVENVVLLDNQGGRVQPPTRITRNALNSLRSMFTYLKFLKDKGCIAVTTPKSWEEAKHIFFNGKAVMFIGGFSEHKFITEEMRLRGYNVVIHPMIGVTGRKTTPIVGGGALYIIRKDYSPQEKEAIKALLNYLTSKEVQLALYNHMGFVPFNKQAFQFIYKNADNQLKTVLDSFINSGNNPANKGSISPAFFNIRLSLEKALLQILHNEDINSTIDQLEKDISKQILYIDTQLYIPNISISIAVILIEILIVYMGYLILIQEYEKYKTKLTLVIALITLSIPFVPSKQPFLFIIGTLTTTLIIGYETYVFLKAYKKVHWLPLPLIANIIIGTYFIFHGLSYLNVYIPVNKITHLLLLLPIPLIISILIVTPNLFFIGAMLMLLTKYILHYTTYVCDVTVCYSIFIISTILIIIGTIYADKKSFNNISHISKTWVKLTSMTTLLIVIIFSLIPINIYWARTSNIAEAIDNNIFNMVLEENYIDGIIGDILKTAIKGDKIEQIAYNPQKDITTVKGQIKTATIPPDIFSDVLQTTAWFREYSLYDIHGNLIIGDTVPYQNVSIITHPLNSIQSQMALVGVIHNLRIEKYITQKFKRTVMVWSYSTALVIIGILIMLFFASRRVNTMLWEELDAKTSEILAMEDSLKEAYNNLQKEHELLMTLIDSIIKKPLTNLTDFLSYIGKRLQENSDEIKGFFVYDPDGALIQSQVSVNTRKILDKYKGKTPKLITTEEGIFIVTKLSTGHILGIVLYKISDHTNTIIETLKAFSELIDILIKMQTLNKKMEKMYTNVLTALVGALDLKDPYTKGHSLHVAEGSIKLGKHLGLPQEELDTLYMAAILHDVGKISIPDYILTKPGKLTKKEYELIKTHPTMGYKLLKPIDGMEKIAEIILYHHERCDGKGYPEGLHCDEIPMLSKIIAVVDAFDAMVNRRVYKRELSLNEAIEEIKRNLGTQFDPYIGEKFLEIAEDIYNIIKEEEKEEQ